MNPQEEVKARLEVAQLYEEMGQKPKAARYYLAAAEICIKAKVYNQARGYLEKVLELDPDNTQGQSYLERLDAHMAAHGLGKPASPAPSTGGGGGVAAAETTGGGGKLTVPTPALYLTQDQISAILSQVSSAPNPKFFPFDPLPKVDTAAIARKAAEAEAKREAERAKNRTSVESAFSSGTSSFTAGSGFLTQSQPSGRRRKKDKEKESEDKPKRRRRTAGNQALAESIAKRIQGG